MLCRILVSSTRKPISYINLAKRFLQEHGEVQLSALGIAVAPMVTVAEILKNRRLAIERKITTSLEVLSDDYRCSSEACLLSASTHVCIMSGYPTGTSSAQRGLSLLSHLYIKSCTSGVAACCRDMFWHVLLTQTNP